MIYLPFFESSDHLKQFQSYLNSKISITIQAEQNSKASFLDVSFIHEQCKFTTRIYWKPTSSGVYTHFDSFLPNIFKIGMIYALVNRYFWICSNWSMSYSQVRLNKNVLEKQLFQKLHWYMFSIIFKQNSYPERKDSCRYKEASFISPSFFRNHIIANFDWITKCITVVLNSCKLQFIFKSQNKIFNDFCFKDPVL